MSRWGKRAVAGIACACSMAACANILDIPSDRYVSSVGADGGDGSLGTTCTGTLEVRVLADLSGPVKVLGAPYLAGELDYFKELNESGGIKGCRIEYQSVDFGYKADKARQIYDGWKADPSWPRVVAIMGFGTPDTLELADQVKVDKKPLLSGTLFASLATPDPISVDVTVPEIGSNFARNTLRTNFSSNGYPYNFFLATDYSTGARIAMFHIKTLGGKRVGFFHCNDPYCTGPGQVARVHAESLGLGLGRVLPLQQSGENQEKYDAAILAYFKQEQSHKVDDPSYTIVDWVWGGNTTGTSAQMAIALDKMKVALAGTTPPIPDVQLILNNQGFSEDLYAICGRACINSVHGIMPYSPYGDTSRGSAEMGKLTALHDKWRQIEEVETGAPVPTHRNVRYVQGYVNATLFKMGVEAIVAQGKPVTGENLKAALETFKNVDMGGLTDRVSFSPKDHRPQSTEAIYKIGTDGALVREPPDRTIALEESWLGW